jgi:hypothetical protein
MWQQTGSFRNATGGILGVSFDTIEERVWISDEEGYISSQSFPISSPPLPIYTSSRACFVSNYENSAWGISNLHKFARRVQSNASGVSIPIGNSLRLYSRDGSLAADIPVSALKNSSLSTASSITNAPSLVSNSPSEGTILCSLGIDTNELDPSINSFNSERSWRTSKLLVAGRLPSVSVLDATKLFSSLDLVNSGKGVGLGSSAVYSIPPPGGGGGGGGGDGAEIISPLRTLQKQPIRILASLPVSHPVMHLCYTENRVILAANGEGPNVSLFDGLLRSSAQTGSLSSCHIGGITSLDSSNSLIATCGNISSSVRTSSYPHTLTINSRGIGNTGGGGGGGGETKAVIDPIVKIYDVRMAGRIANSFSVPIGNGLFGSGPLFVKFMPNTQEVIYGVSPPLLIGTSDGRFYVVQDAVSNRRFDLLAQVDLGVSAMLRHETYIPNHNSTYPRITSVALSSSGLAIAAGDADGICHMISPMAGVHTSKIGNGNYFCQPGLRYHGVDPWIVSTDPLIRTPQYIQDVTVTESVITSSITNNISRENDEKNSAVIQKFGGNAGTSDELKSDACIDATYLQGVGYDVPLASPGFSSLSPSNRDSWAFGKRIERWSRLWSVPLGAMQNKSVNEMLKHSPLYGMGENDERAAQVLLSQQLQQQQRVIPGLYLASTLPEWTNNTVMVPSRRKIVDSLLLQMAVKTATSSSSSSNSNSSSASALIYVNNRMPSTGFRPNSLIFGKRRGFVTSDPRRKAEKSCMAPLDSTGKVKSTKGGRDRVGSMDSLSTSGSLGDIDGVGDDFLVNNEDEDEDDEIDEVEGIFILTEGNVSSSTSSSSPPQAYCRPKVKFNPIFGYDIDFSAYNHCPTSLGPFAGFEEVGPNSFVNAALQLFFFCSPLRARIQRHICSAPACVACEIRFVFDALCQAPLTSPDSRVVSSQPLLRTLHNVTEVSRLGLLHPCTLDPPKRMEMFVKVLLEKLSRETHFLSALHYKEYKDTSISGSTSKNATIVAAIGGTGVEKTAESLLQTPWDSALSSKAVDVAVNSGIPLHFAAVSGGASVDELVSFRTKNITTCTLKGHSSSRDGSTRIVELTYPDSPLPSSPPSFCSLLTTALSATRSISRAWCDGCSNYTPQKESRSLYEIGDYLFVSTGLTTHTVSQQQKEVIASESNASVESTYNVSTSTQSSVAAKEAPLAYARQLWTMSKQNSWLPTSIKVTCKSNSISASTETLELTHVNVTELDSKTENLDSNDVFSLVGVIVHVAQPNRSSVNGNSNTSSSSTPLSSITEEGAIKRYHYTSCLKLSNDGAYNCADKSSWVIFNHFRITPAEEGEVLNFTSLWKTPCVLLFQRSTPRFPHPLYSSRTITHPQRGLSQQQVNDVAKRRQSMGYVYFSNTPINKLSLTTTTTSDISSSNNTINGGNDISGNSLSHLILADLVRIPPSVFSIPLSIPHQPLIGAASVSGINAIPAEISTVAGINREGGLVAIDAEFVIVSTERSKILPDGSKRILVPARSMPGRVSIMRADGSTLLDSYLCAAEKVVDHLTRFSGIYEGDLDPKTSSHRLLTQKEIHLRLRALIDNGITFVGHGLRKDCRELNIVIPRQQTIDTVRLYQLPSQRFLSLKFLTSHVLNTSIQAGVHDSCEDAHFSMQLYQKYLSLKGKHLMLETDDTVKSPQENDSEKDDFEILLHKLYEQGRSSGWRTKSMVSSGNVGNALLPPRPS